MSEYQEQNSVARLIGSPPGYVGYEEGGQLTEEVRKQPYSIVVCDEIDKAYKTVFDTFLQVFEEGNLTDGKGRTVDFSNTIIILTGNVGSEYFDDIGVRGFESIKVDVLKEAKLVYRPEFLNRIDSVIVFKPLTPEAISQIVDLQIEKLNKRLTESGIKIEPTPEMHKFLEKVGYDPKYGARPLRRAVETYVGNKITPKLLSKTYKSGDIVIADYKDDNVVFGLK
jgi:ATP-dependent Clp protease ATP-binding subunit ClpC